MTGRVQSLLEGAGLKENVLGSLERGDSMFVLTEQTLLFQDSGGTRRVTLRDLKRIHSDQEGLLRVETPAGTALTASLLGFDPAAVQTFFAQVRDATAKAKQSTPTTTAAAPASSPMTSQVGQAQTLQATPPQPTPIQPVSRPVPNPPSAPSQPDAQWSSERADNRAAPSSAPLSPTPPSPTPASPTPTPVAPAAPPIQPQVQPQVPPARTTFGTPPATPPAPAVRPAVTPAPVSPPPARPVAAPAPTPELGLSSQNPSRPAPTTLPPTTPPPTTLAAPSFTPAAVPSKTVSPPPVTPAPAAPPAKPTVRAVRNPTIITDPSVASAFDDTKAPGSPITQTGIDHPRDQQPRVDQPKKEEPLRPAAGPAVVPGRVTATAAGALASLAAVAGRVSGWSGALRVLAVIEMLFALGYAYLLYSKGQGLNGFWILLGGLVGGAAVLALADLMRLVVSLAQAVSAEGGVMDVD